MIDTMVDVFSRLTWLACFGFKLLWPTQVGIHDAWSDPVFQINEKPTEVSPGEQRLVP